MRSNLKLTAIAAALVSAAILSLPAPATAAEEHKHEQSAATTHKLTLNNGKKWTTDEPLRKGMSEIRSLVAAQDEAIHKGKLKPEDYAALGSKIERQVGYIVANCKLDPEADANLHIILEHLIAGADAMQGKDKQTSPRAGAGKVVAGLNSYGKYFDHPGWKRL
jgi:hypothetical protein